MPAMPIADSSAPIVVGIRQTKQRHEDHHRYRRSRVVAERLEDDHHRQEDDREHGQEDRQGELVGRLLAVGALHEGDHAVQEGLPWFGGDHDHDAVG